MKFGITLKPDISVERIVGLARQAEAAGFEYGWIFDSHVLWKEPYPLLALMANATREDAAGAVRDQSRGARPYGYGQSFCDAQPDFGRTDGVGYRARRQLAPGVG